MSKRILPGVLDSISRGYQIKSSVLMDKFYPANDLYNDQTRATDGGGCLVKDFTTPTAASIFTYSTWVKRGRLNVSNPAMDLMSCGTHDISLNNQIWIYDDLNMYSDGTYFFGTKRKFRDTSAWYHIVIACDGTKSTGPEKIKVYVNGVQETNFTTDNRASFPGTNKFNSAIGHSVGGHFYSGKNHIEGYMAETNFIDGQQLTPASFGVFDSNGIWSPIKYSGAYGNNGFYLDYNDSSNSYIHTSATATAPFGGTANSAKVADSTYVISNTSTGSGFTLIQYDMGSQVFMSGYEIKKLRFTGGTSTFKVQTSTDGSTYTDLSPLSVTSVDQDFYGPIGRTARYVRIQSTTFGTNGQAYVDYFGIHNYQIGKDVSGRSNHFGASSIDSLIKTYDIPTINTLDNRYGNYCTFLTHTAPSEAGKKSYPYKGNTAVNLISADRALGSFPLRSGKWYAEFRVVSGDLVNGTDTRIGIITADQVASLYSGDGGGYPGNVGCTGYSYWSTGVKAESTSSSQSSGAYGASWIAGDTIGLALDLDNNKIWWSKNGTWQSSGNPAAGTNAAYTISQNTWVMGIWNGNGAVRNKRIHANFGQFAYQYTPPVGFNPINTSYLSSPTILDPATYVDVVAYSGSSSQQTIQLSKTTPDLLWIKNRTGTANYWNVTDNARGKAGNGFYYQLATNALDVETSYTATVSDMSNNSFTVSGNDGRTNQVGGTHIAYAWKEGGQPGFDAVAYTAPASGVTANISHNLGAIPNIIITKSRTSATFNWVVYAKDMMPNNQFLRLNTNDSLVTYGTGNSVWGTHTTSTFAVVGDGAVVPNTPCIAYLWSEIPGFSKFGKFTANGITGDGPFVLTGFKPKFIIIKSLNTSDDWVIEDSVRNNMNSNDSSALLEKYILANSSANEGTEVLRDIYSNGFKVMGGPQNRFDGNTFLYMAFAEDPFKYSLAR